MRSLGISAAGCSEGMNSEGRGPCLPGQTIPAPSPAVDGQEQVPPPQVPTPQPVVEDPSWPDAVRQVLTEPLLFLGIIAVLVALLFLIRIRRRTSRVLPIASGGSAQHRPAPSGAGGQSRRYEALIQGLIGTYDLSDSQVVRAHVEKSLRGAGITAVVPAPGDPFDASLHNGVAGVAAPEPGLVLHIARVLRPGWQSMDGVLRPPDVEVFKERNEVTRLQE